MTCTVKITSSAAGDGADCAVRFSPPVTEDNCEDPVARVGLAVAKFLEQLRDDQAEGTVTE